MSAPADIILTAGAITLANEAVFAPVAGRGVNINWRVIPATAIAALLLDGLSRLNNGLAMGVAVTALITTVFGSFGNAGSPVTNLARVMGYQK